LRKLAKLLKISLDSVYQEMIENLERQVDDSKKKACAYEDDPWVKLDIEEIACDTGKRDLSINHDHYLYGAKKRIE